MRILILILAITCRIYSVELPVEKRFPKAEMGTSVIVPCAAQHFEHLFDLLTVLQNQTSIPNEVVISLSSSEAIQETTISALENHNWPFCLKIICNEGKRSPGQNRNIAAQNATNEILICQDADDLPHPQRIEIAKYMFETYDIDHLLHVYVTHHRTFLPYIPEEIPIFRFSDYAEMSAHCNRQKIYIHNGNICVSKEVTKHIFWNDNSYGEDVNFNDQVYLASYKCAVTPARLIMYRLYLSTQTPGSYWPDDGIN